MKYSAANAHNKLIRQVLILFHQLTKINLTFIDDSLQLFDRKVIITNQKQINNFFFEKKALIFFPLITNQQISGLFIANTSAISNNVANLYKESLESISKDILSLYYQDISILAPIETSRLKKDVNLLHFIMSNCCGNDISYNENLTKENQKIEISNINSALSYIEKNIAKKLTLIDVSKQSYISPAYLSRLFKEYFIVNFSNYIGIRKIALAQEQLVSSTESIDNISKQIGFSRASYFNKVFKERTGLTPLQFRKKYNSKKVYTIHREIDWQNNTSVYGISSRYFKEKGIPFEIHDVNGSPYISSIGGLATSNSNNGWIFLVDGKQPQTLPSNLYVKNKSVIQWFYIIF